MKKRRYYNPESTSYSTDTNGIKYTGEPMNLYKSKVDGSCEKLIGESNFDVLDFCMNDQVVFYIVYNDIEKCRVIYKLDLNKDNKKKLILRTEDVSEKKFSEERILFASNNWVVWIEGDKSFFRPLLSAKIKRANINGEGSRELDLNINVGKRPSIIGNYLFYIEKNSEDELYRLDLRDFSKISIDYKVISIDTPRW